MQKSKRNVIGKSLLKHSLRTQLSQNIQLVPIKCSGSYVFYGKADSPGLWTGNCIHTNPGDKDRWIKITCALSKASFSRIIIEDISSVFTLLAYMAINLTLKREVLLNYFYSKYLNLSSLFKGS